MVTRTQVAGFVAEKMSKDRKAAVRSAAAWLVANGRQRQADYLARDVAAALARDGYVLAKLVSARPLSATAQNRVEAFIKHETGAKRLELITETDPELVGGVQIEIPGAHLDATVRRQLTQFVERATK